MTVSNHFIPVIHFVKPRAKYSIAETIDGKPRIVGPMKLVGLEFYQCDRGFIYTKDGKYFVRDCPERDLKELVE